MLVEAEWLPAETDPGLLDDARLQWQLGDWKALASMSLDTVTHHPQRATIAMLCGAAHQQLDNLDQARELMNKARQWGASKAQVVQVLAAGVHNVLGRVAALNGLDDQSLGHFRSAIALETDKLPSNVALKARATSELQSLGATGAGNRLSSITGPGFEQKQRPQTAQDDEDCRTAHVKWCQGRWTELIKLDNAILPKHSHRIMLSIYAACGYQQIDDGDAEQRCVQTALEWGADREIIKKYLLSGIYHRLGKANIYMEDYREAARYFRKSLEITGENKSHFTEYLKNRLDHNLTDISSDELDNVFQYL